MDFEICIPRRKPHVRVKLKQNITKSRAEQFMKEATALGMQKNVRKLIVDLRGFSSESSIADKYSYAHREANTPALGHFLKTALLADEVTKDLTFMETVMQNAGFNFRLFTNETKAITWLDA